MGSVKMSSDAEKLWQILVALKRSLDDHETKPNKLEILKSDWNWAADEANKVKDESRL